MTWTVSFDPEQRGVTQRQRMCCAVFLQVPPFALTPTPAQLLDPQITA